MNATGVSYVPNGVLYTWLDMQIIHHLDGYVPFKSIRQTRRLWLRRFQIGEAVEFPKRKTWTRYDDGFN